MERHELAATIVGSGTVRSRHADAGFRNLLFPVPSLVAFSPCPSLGP